MKQIFDFGDDRNKGWCVYCGGPGETRDHVPSRVLLDEPYPAELPVLPACAACNGSFSADEAYLACLIECTLTGSVDSATARRKVGRILDTSPVLAARLDTARYERNGETGFNPELERIRPIILKLARGHAAFENNEPRIGSPESMRFIPFTAMNEEERERFEAGVDGQEGSAFSWSSGNILPRRLSGIDCSGRWFAPPDHHPVVRDGLSRFHGNQKPYSGLPGPDGLHEEFNWRFAGSTFSFSRGSLRPAGRARGRGCRRWRGSRRSTPARAPGRGRGPGFPSRSPRRRA